MPSSDFRAVPGTGRARFENAEGANISRRAYENLRAQEKGAPSYRAAVAALPFRSHKGNPEYDRHLIQYVAANNVSRRAAMKAGSEFNQLFTHAYVMPDGKVLGYFDRPDASRGIDKNRVSWLLSLLRAEGFDLGVDISRYLKN